MDPNYAELQADQPQRSRVSALRELYERNAKSSKDDVQPPAAITRSATLDCEKRKGLSARLADMGVSAHLDRSDTYTTARQVDQAPECPECNHLATLPDATDGVCANVADLAPASGGAGVVNGVVASSNDALARLGASDNQLGEENTVVIPHPQPAEEEVEVQMDKNLPVMHCLKGSISQDVTPSDPDSVLELFNSVADESELAQQLLEEEQWAAAQRQEEAGLDNPQLPGLQGSQRPPQCTYRAADDVVGEESMLMYPPPAKRMGSTGTLQRVMGRSLRGRGLMGLNLPPEPYEEVNLNIPLRKFSQLKYLAQGAMCAAYTATYKGQKIVLKTPLQGTPHFEIASNDIEVEMLLLSELHHENIVSIKGAGWIPDGRRFIAMEYLDGGTLASRIRPRSGMPHPPRLSLEECLDLALQLSNALEYLHDMAVPGRIICHRDLKPDNLAFDAKGRLKVLDFGLGKIMKRKFRTKDSSYMMTGGTGSLRYMAPEVANHHEYNEKADVYSFSLILWEMLAGVKPFDGFRRDQFYQRVCDNNERPALDSAWPVQLQRMLELCWDRDLETRLSFREVSAHLAALRKGIQEELDDSSEGGGPALIPFSMLRESQWSSNSRKLIKVADLDPGQESEVVASTAPASRGPAGLRRR